MLGNRYNAISLLQGASVVRAGIMRSSVVRFVLASSISVVLIAICGCRSSHALPETIGNQTHAVDRITRQVERPSVHVHEAAYSTAPVTVRDRVGIENLSYRDLSLDEVLQIAMSNREILRELGGTCLLYTSPSPRDQRGSRMPSSA